MELITTKKEIIQNAVRFDSYRDSVSIKDKMFYKDRMRLGNIFIYFNINDKDVFCPSRFAGYNNNNRQKHEAFAQKHGTHTTQKIDSILGKHASKKELEAKYQKLCNDVGVAPADKKRQYWSMSLSEDVLLDIFPMNVENYPDELSQSNVYTEGASKKVLVNAYERNEEARNKCIKYYGCKCAVCGLIFNKIYGEIGADFIHVHHVKPLAMIKKEYSFDPIKDLQPVCPNCHAMLHKKDPPFSIVELKGIIEKNQLKRNHRNIHHGE